MTNPKCPNCTKWYNCAKCEAGYEDQLCTCPDNPEFDGTDGAHPAWWRGSDQTTIVIAKKFTELIEKMESGETPEPNFGSKELNQLFDKIKQLNDSVAFTTEWYAVRMERIKDLAKQHYIWTEVACILANGHLNGQIDGKWYYEPPTYAQQMSMLKRQAEKLQKELKDAKEEIARLQNQSKQDQSS